MFRLSIGSRNILSEGGKARPLLRKPVLGSAKREDPDRRRKEGALPSLYCRTGHPLY